MTDRVFLLSEQSRQFSRPTQLIHCGEKQHFVAGHQWRASRRPRSYCVHVLSVPAREWRGVGVFPTTWSESTDEFVPGLQSARRAQLRVWDDRRSHSRRHAAATGPRAWSIVAYFLPISPNNC